MVKLLVTLDIAKKLKDLNFNVPTAHCFTHNSDDKYELELFSYFLETNDLYMVYQDEKQLRNVDTTKEMIKNESEIYFDYNQDMRKLFVRVYSGEEFMNDEKAYNMYVDSLTFSKWSEDDFEKFKIELPNYNDGDFEWYVYNDVISTPTWQQVEEWIKNTHNIYINIEHQKDGSCTYKLLQYKGVGDGTIVIYDSIELGWAKFINVYDYEARNHAISKAIDIINAI